MPTTAKLSNILLASVLGASASAAYATDAGKKSYAETEAERNARVNAEAYNKIFNQTATNTNGIGGSVSAGANNSQTTSINIGPAPEILKESHDLGACSGSAYQAVWQTVKYQSLYQDRTSYGLIGVTDNSFTLRQYQTESDASRAKTVEAIDEKIKPKPSFSATIAGAGFGKGGNTVSSSGANSTSYTVPKTYTDVTYHCTLDK